MADEAPPAAKLVTPSVLYDGAWVDVPSGGARRGGGYTGSLHLRLKADAPAASAWAGTSAFVDVRSIHGQQPGARVGDAQGVTNFAGPTGTDIEELWVQHNFEHANASILAGIYDLNTEFYRLQGAGLFLNSSFGIGPEFAQSGVEGPSIFPRTAAGLRLSYKPSPGIVLRAALMDGVPVVRPDGSRGAFRSGDGLLGVAEAALLSRPDNTADDPTDARAPRGRFSGLPSYADKLALSVWRYTGRTPKIDDPGSPAGPAASGVSGGAYLVAERRLIGRDADAKRAVSTFVQLGLASARTNRFGVYVGAGLVGTGWVPGRPADQWGVSVVSARNGSPYLRSERGQDRPVTRAETTVELSYQAQLTPWLTLQPDLQYVRHPNTDPSVPDAWVVQLRFECSF